ncbi:protein NDNF isoform X2 [Onthophagus taurus]
MIISCRFEDVFCRKSKRTKPSNPPPPQLREEQFVKFVRKDAQITAFLRQGQNKTFYTWSNTNNSYLSITILTCSSELIWTLDYSLDNSSVDVDGAVDNKNRKNLLGNLSSSSRKVVDIDTLSFWTQKGLYAINVKSEYKSTFLHLYVSTVIEFPFDALQNSHSNLKVSKRRRKRLTVTWNPSLIDPHVTDYCVVINTIKSYRTLCSAQYENEEPQVIKYDHHHHKRRKDLNKDLSLPKISCVGKRTHFTLNDLQKGQNYFVDVFAINQQTNLTYPYGSTKTKFDAYIKPTSLKDGKLTFVNLKKLDGKAEFIYKLEKSSENSLEFYFIPCGLMDIEIILKHNGTKSKSRLKNFGKITIDNPTPLKYFLRVLDRNFSSDIRRSSGVKVLATTKPSKIPFPVLPSRTEVHEYISMRKCDQITIGWYASPMKNNAKYCVAIKKGKLQTQNDKLDLTDRCRDFNLKSLGVTYCKEFKEFKSVLSSQDEIIMETIENLESGESYVVYVSIQKKKGKTLSYDLLQAYTKAECS